MIYAIIFQYSYYLISESPTTSETSDVLDMLSEMEDSSYDARRPLNYQSDVNSNSLSSDNNIDLKRIKRNVPDWIHRRELPTLARRTALTRPPPVYVYINKQLHDGGIHDLDEILHEKLISEASETVPSHYSIRKNEGMEISGHRTARRKSRQQQDQTNNSGEAFSGRVDKHNQLGSDKEWHRRFTPGGI